MGSSILKTNTLLLILCAALFISFFNLQYLSQVLYRSYFVKFKQEKIERILSQKYPDLDLYLSTVPEIDLKTDSNESISCTHLTVGEKGFSEPGGIVYLRVFCVQYDIVSKHINQKTQLPFAITLKNRAVTAYKTVQLTTYDQNFKEVFPFYLKPFVFSGSQPEVHPDITLLRQRMTEKHGISENTSDQ